MIIGQRRATSAFKEKGVLSVSEFVLAGDDLASKCPTCSWLAIKSEFLLMNVNSKFRFLVFEGCEFCNYTIWEYEAAGGEVLVDDEDDDGWLATHGKPKDKGNEDENLPSMKSGIRSMPTYFGAEEEDDDIPDMEEFDEADNVVENDTATLQSTYLVAHEPDDDNILRTPNSYK
ncbi:hypothetical protein HID58_086651 [Brassica napus]|uniref:Uncharacterized protein n=1 Tax=Brassica napus TaxID=3708 RepID=A0ABQ7XU19_BRANA|nr:hypothetical protein HID58_086651 [Brassica napus]